ncbi:ABC transporter ATP-binding protein [Ottowia thiooxydans]|uniref:Branched-chain amino acid transport system ATP-binding protein n=1 Tax=Ottowia thiooxydans TaxID=219182 RepID=A0ABV2QAX5_9BURK
MLPTKSDEIVLKTVGLTKEFGTFCAVKDVNLQVRKGDIHALIGPNGAGKTTCFHLITKFLSPTHGKILFKDQDITHKRAPEVARQGLVRSFQISAVFPEMSVQENVRIAVQRRREPLKHSFRSDLSLSTLNERCDELLEEVGLTGFENSKAGGLSYGRKRALELATTLALQPELLLLDEPLAGLGQEDIHRVAGLIRKAAIGRTVLMVEHNLSVVATLCDRITVLARGEILSEGDYKHVSSDPRVVEAYIGGGKRNASTCTESVAANDNLSTPARIEQEA